MEVRDIAWAAGIVEGEGSLQVRNRGLYNTVVVHVAMTDLDVLQSLQAVFGIGNIHGPYNQRNGTKPIWHWNVTCAKDVAAVVMTLYPLLHERRQEQARAVLVAWRQMRGHKNGRRYC